jgi:hypothetical protein|tara:strand:- start:1642 stop:2064 length:423 start_codon:yes stop_codon:yes gene_type:complete
MDFLVKNSIYIILLSILIIGSLSIFSIFNDKFKDVPPFYHNNKNDKRMVQIDTFENANDSLEKTFCNKHQSQPHILRKHCKNLGKRGCHIPDCCILVNNEDCVPGGIHGPTYLTDNGKPISIKFWKHNNQCFDGSEKCPK